MTAYPPPTFSNLIFGVNCLTALMETSDRAVLSLERHLKVRRDDQDHCGGPPRTVRSIRRS